VESPDVERWTQGLPAERLSTLLPMYHTTQAKRSLVLEPARCSNAALA